MRAWGRLRAWWNTSTFVEDVALAFMVITVVNSIMMLTGLDEPKTGTWAYWHLLSRLGIVAVVVGVFSFDELRERLRDWRRAAELWRWPRRRQRRTLTEVVLRAAIARPTISTALVFTTMVGAASVAAIASAALGIHEPAGGPGLYRSLVALAAVLALVVGAGWWLLGRSRPPASAPDSRG